MQISPAIKTSLSTATTLTAANDNVYLRLAANNASIIEAPSKNASRLRLAFIALIVFFAILFPSSVNTVLKRDFPEGEFTVSGGTKLIYMPDHLGGVRDVITAAPNPA